MNGEKHNNLFNAALILAVGLVIASAIFGWSYSKSKKGDESITVTGSAKKRIKSDLIVWSASVTAQSGQLSEAYKQLADNMPKVKKYLIEKGIPENQITISSINSVQEREKDSEGNQTGKITGYSLKQDIQVKSNDVEKVSQIAREATELINQGIFIESSAPQFIYTKLGDLKIEMLAEAAKDAKARAEQIANSTGNSIGTVRSAKMGVMQITAADSNEVSDYGVNDTAALEKDITAVVNVSFAIN
ncbi:MAG: SIMPL domain-containing protein [Pyrinomonadaceae bacterium]|nr:SIMPL domain-containing protein [Pyrinomonadaceae bacterium]